MKPDTNEASQAEQLLDHDPGTPIALLQEAAHDVLFDASNKHTESDTEGENQVLNILATLSGQFLQTGGGQ